MANVSRIHGFTPVGTLSGGIGSMGYVQKCIKGTDATALAVGDPVKLVAGALSLGIPTVTAWTTTADANYGIVVSMESWDGSDADVVSSLDKPRYVATSTRMYVLVAISPDLIFEAQVASLEDGDIGSKADPIDGGADADAQTSGFYLDTPAATETLGCSILEIVSLPDNALGAYGKVRACWNMHQLGRGIKTTGGQGGVHA